MLAASAPAIAGRRVPALLPLDRREQRRGAVKASLARRSGGRFLALFTSGMRAGILPGCSATAPDGSGDSLSPGSVAGANPESGGGVSGRGPAPVKLRQDP